MRWLPSAGFSGIPRGALTTGGWVSPSCPPRRLGEACLSHPDLRGPHVQCLDVQ